MVRFSNNNKFHRK